jgi:hypothetical protein
VLAERARQLGWTSVEVIDDDLGVEPQHVVLDQSEATDGRFGF